MLRAFCAMICRFTGKSGQEMTTVVRLPNPWVARDGFSAELAVSRVDWKLADATAHRLRASAAYEAPRRSIVVDAKKTSVSDLNAKYYNLSEKRLPTSN